MNMLHPDASGGLNNNKYLEIDIKDVDGTISTEIFGIENREIDDNFFCKYNKCYMAEGELQKKFVVEEKEELIVPIDNENRF